MAGVKGRSGGARPGAGRKKTPAVPISRPTEAETAQATAFDPRPTLVQIAQGLVEVSPQQFNALRALLQDSKKAEGGKKDQQQAAAKQVASRFASAAPPKLVAAGGKKV